MRRACGAGRRSDATPSGTPFTSSQAAPLPDRTDVPMLPRNNPAPQCGLSPRREGKFPANVPAPHPGSFRKGKCNGFPVECDRRSSIPQIIHPGKGLASTETVDRSRGSVGQPVRPGATVVGHVQPKNACVPAGHRAAMTGWRVAESGRERCSWARWGHPMPIVPFIVTTWPGKLQKKVYGPPALSLLASKVTDVLWPPPIIWVCAMMRASPALT